MPAWRRAANRVRSLNRARAIREEQAAFCQLVPPSRRLGQALFTNIADKATSTRSLPRLF
jgi:hypothetical protein